MKTISILIAAYQAKNWLADCLDSVFKQSLPEGWQMQVLLGVDGCPDTLSHAQQFKHTSLSIIALKKNRGTYITFNTLMRLAEGDIICRFDADDVMQKAYLARQIEALEAGTDMTMTWSIYTDETLKATSHVIAHEVYHPKEGLNCRPSEGQMTMRRQVVEHLGGYRPWPCGADTDFFKRLRCAGFTHQIIEEHLYFRRTHTGSLTAHPRTNFQSPLRIKIQRLTDKYEEKYLSGEKSLSINAKYESNYDVI